MDAMSPRTIKNDVPFAVTVGGGPLPEQMEIEFSTSGFEGGNGSTHELVFTWGGGGFEPEIAANGLRLKVQGDWELEGMLDALISLGEHLRLYRQNVGRSLFQNLVDP
jgi:hypothetical protein